MNRIQVYDLNHKSFRYINEKQCTSDDKSGIIFFKRDAIFVIEKYYKICGMFLIDKKSRRIYPIDMQYDIITIFEFIFNNMMQECKDNLLDFNLVKKPKNNFSYSYLILFGGKDIQDLKEYDPFSYICNYIIHNQYLLNMFIYLNRNIYVPKTYRELCSTAQIINIFFDIDYISPDYEKNFKYVIDALLNGYRINMTEKEIQKYNYQICKLACQNLEA